MRCSLRPRARTDALLQESLGFSAMIGDFRLALEVAVITALAQRILGLIKTRDPLSENVHLTRIGVMGGTLFGVAAGSCARLARGAFASHRSTDERVIGSVPLGAWQTITFVTALRHNKMIAPMVVEGAMNGEMFLAYVESCLVPTLQRNDIVVMDNCRVHLGSSIREAIEKPGATLRYLPKYSPDLNPIEMAYSKFKTFLRKVAARNVPGLTRAIRSFIPQLGRQECTNYFTHAGYGSI